MIENRSANVLAIPQNLIFGLFSDRGWDIIRRVPEDWGTTGSLTSAGTAFRDAIARREAAPSARHRAEAW